MEEKWADIQESLRNLGYSLYADLLSNYSEKRKNERNHLIGFIGDDLVGKSTIINMILGEEVLSTSVIPSAAEITVRYGESREVFLSSEKIEDSSDIEELIEEKNKIVFNIPNTFLKDNCLEFREFHGLLSKQKIKDFSFMLEVYKCDAVVLVMSAEHLFSEAECLFIENYIQYVGASHILLVVNKLSIVADSDIDHVLEYAQKQVTSKFSNVKWSIYDFENRNISTIAKYRDRNIREEIIHVCNTNMKVNDVSVNNMIQYIKSKLYFEMEELKAEQGKSEAEIKRKNEKIAEQKEMEKASIEIAIVEFQQKRNLAVNAIDSFIKEKFDEISVGLSRAYSEAVDKYLWYENEFEDNWRKSVSAVSEKTDKFASEEVFKDIEWLNSILQTKLGVIPINVDISEENLATKEKISPYGTYKKYASIGIGGGVIIGYCLFRIVGAVIGLGGGILAYSCLNAKDKAQDTEIQRDIASRIRDVSTEVRKLSKRDIEKLYDDVLSEFKKQAKEIIDSKYMFTNIKKSDFTKKIVKVSELIKDMEEV